MKQRIKFYYQNYESAYYIVRPFFIIYNFFRLKRYLSQKQRVKLKFKNKFGYKLDLSKPITLNEKLNWLKIYDRNPLYTKIVDKYSVREYVKDKIGEQYLIPLVFSSNTVKDLEPKNFPAQPFIIKTNHDSSGGIIVMNKNQVDWKKIKISILSRINENYYYYWDEWPYKNIQRKIIAEKLLFDGERISPLDYKMLYLNNELILTAVIDRSEKEKTCSMFDENWNKINVQWGVDFKIGPPYDKPSVYETLKDLGKKLSKEFVCIRVDFYIIKNKIYFGELTLYDGSGLAKFSDYKYDEILGAKLDLSTLKF